MNKNLSNKLVKACKAKAHHLNPVVMIGDKGLTASVIKEVELALTAHELIKIKVAADRDIRESMAETIAKETNAFFIQHIGRILVFYRPKED